VANHPSAEKRNRQRIVKTARNRAINSTVRTLVKRVRTALHAKDKSAADVALKAATKALDRVLLWHNYVVPQWTYSKVRTARWDRFGRPAEMPKYGLSAFPALWWYDADKAAKVGKRS